MVGVTGSSPVAPTTSSLSDRSDRSDGSLAVGAARVIGCGAVETNPSSDLHRSRRCMVWPLGAGVEGSPEAVWPTARLGEAGASLMRLSAARFPVPPGFVISAEVGAFYARSGGRFPPGVWDQIRQQLARIERTVVSERDRAPRPLLLRVRMEAPVDEAVASPTVMVLGVSEAAAERLADATGHTAPGWRAWARLLRAYGSTVLHAAPDVLDETRTRLLRRHRVASETALTAEGARELCAELRRVLWDQARQPVPIELEDQLRGLLVWAYERWSHVNCPDESTGGLRFGVPVVATMAVLSDLDESSVACAAWSRDPITGAPGVSGRLLADDTQPPDPSAGLPLATLASARDPQLRVAHGQIQRYTQRAEQIAGWPQMIEYVVESGRLWVVGALPARAAPWATLRWAVDLVGADGSDRGGPVRDVLLRLTPRDLGRQVRLPTATRHVRETVLEWCRAHRRIQVLGLQIGEHPPGAPDASAADGVMWWLEASPGSDRPREAMWAVLNRLFARHRGRPVALVVPADWFAPRATAPAAGVASTPLAHLPPVLRRAVRARIRPRLAIAVPAGDLGRGALAAIEALRREVQGVEGALERRLRIETGVAVDCPRAVLVLDSVSEMAAFAVLDLDRLDAALRGRRFRADEANHRPFDADGLGVLIETGVRRVREAQPRFRLVAALRGMPSPALLRLCLRLELDAIAVPDPLAAPASLAAAQVSLRVEVSESAM